MMDTTKDFESFLSITENRARIMAVIVAMVRDFSQAEDLFQETVLEILKSSDRFDPDRDFAPWACGIARNVVRRHWRRQKRPPLIETQDALEALAAMAHEDEPDLWRQERVALHDCLERIPDRMRRMFVLRYASGFKGAELARRAEVRMGSVRTTLARLRRKLRDCIDMKVGQSA